MNTLHAPLSRSIGSISKLASKWDWNSARRAPGAIPLTSILFAPQTISASSCGNDSDDDGLKDGEEVNTYHTDPNDADNAEALLRKGNRKPALDKLTALRMRIDGCGAVCDSNDWSSIARSRRRSACWSTCSSPT